MKAQFTAAGLNRNVPFNPDGTYLEEESAGTLYKNPARLAWVKLHSA